MAIVAPTALWTAGSDVAVAAEPAGRRARRRAARPDPLRRPHRPRRPRPSVSPLGMRARRRASLLACRWRSCLSVAAAASRSRAPPTLGCAVVFALMAAAPGAAHPRGRPGHRGPRAQRGGLPRADRVQLRRHRDHGRRLPAAVHLAGRPPAAGHRRAPRRERRHACSTWSPPRTASRCARRPRAPGRRRAARCTSACAARATAPRASWRSPPPSGPAAAAACCTCATSPAAAAASASSSAWPTPTT